MECAQVVMVPAQTLHHHGHNQAPSQHQHQPLSAQFNQHQNQASNVHSHYTMQPVMQQQQHSNHQQHQIQFSNNNHPTHHHQQHQQQQQQRPDGRHQTVAPNNHQQQQHYQRHQQQQQLHQVYSPLNTIGAPPTPPSDESSGPANCLYLPLHQQHATETVSHQHRTSTGQWVLQQQQQVVSGLHQAGRPARVAAQLQPAQLATSNNQAQSPASNGHGQQQSTIASYFYDIDDGFSDIMSAPPTPEPALQMIAGAPQQHHHQNQRLQFESQHHQRTSPAQVDCQHQQQLRTASNHELNDYQPSYLAYGAQQQHQQQHQHQLATSGPLVFATDPIGHYTAAMSPDSLSTTSSSPSDHSLYQLSPPMPTSHNHQGQQRVGAPFGYLQRGSPAALANRVSGGQQQQHRELDHQPRASPPVNHQQRNPQTPGKAAAATDQIQLVPADTRDGGNSYRAMPIKAATAANQQQPLASCNGQVTAAPPPPQSHRSSPIHLWEFLKELLQQVDSGCADVSVIRWLDRQKGVFKIEDSVKVAKLWGKRKNKPKMNYDKLSRSIRQYYKKGIMKKTDRSQRLVYQFCSAYCH